MHQLPHTFAGLAVADGLLVVAVVTLLAVVTMAACRVVTAVQADTSAGAPGKLVQLHVEATSTCVEVTFAGWVGVESKGRYGVGGAENLG